MNSKESLTSNVSSDMNKAAFFDRDGTLIEDVNYLSNIDQIKILPGIVKLCLDLQKNGYMIMVVTNQSGVARGYYDEKFVEEANIYLGDLFEKYGVFINKFYYCPHHPVSAISSKYNKKCCCRKPEPGMLLQAAEEFDIDLSKSLMFGDKETDLMAGNAVGCKSFYIQDFIEK